MPDPFGDIFGNFLGETQAPGNAATSEPKKKPEKGLPWAAKQFDGKYYVPLTQVVELLKQNDVLPAVRRGLEDRIALLENQKHLDI